jgi:FkbM family methyltransferase
MISDKGSNSHMQKALKKLVSILPAEAPRKLYHAALKVPVARDILGRVVRSIIPEKVEVNGMTIFLDQEDIAVSGTLALTGFESYETDLFIQALKPGMTVLDIGAHIGYYSLLAARAVGPAGHVYSFEPEPRNNALLRKNIAANGLKNVNIIDVAASDAAGTHDFYLEKFNKGHHSFGKGSSTAEKITVKTDTVDHVLGSLSPDGVLQTHGVLTYEGMVQPLATLRAYDKPRVDLVKIDIEGAEPIAFRGMQETIARSPHLAIFAEVYPKAIERLGGTAVAFLEQLTSYGFKLWAIDEQARKLEPIRDIKAFAASIPGGESFRNIIAARE